ncbi:hypothetical protein ACE1ET_14985 [Saccharicrinis sp. FJH62]|uniref:hypothetical protein n=1 Tax=Saccharicrinis sp. FJH62 TaxID=3344657 RepID=UPI0035D43DBB
MKNSQISPVRLLVAAIAVLLFSCSDTKMDPCDDTVAPEITVSLKATVTVLDKDNNPIPDQLLYFNIYKIPCGTAAKGFFNFDGNTNESGMRASTVVGYNLRNTEDEIWVDVHAVNLGNGSAEADSEYAILSYDDFESSITTKEIHVFIYRKF